MTQIKRKKTNNGGKWICGVSMGILLIVVWFIAMLGPFHFHDSAVERNQLAGGGTARENLSSLLRGQLNKNNVDNANKEVSEDESDSEDNKEDEESKDDQEDENELEDAEEENDEEGKESAEEEEESNEENMGEEEEEDNPDGEENDEAEIEGADAMERRLAESIRIKNQQIAKQAKDNNDGSNELGSKRYIMELAGLTIPESGKVVIETRPAWAPIGAAHFDELVQNGFYDQCRFFRVVPDFMVQFGINGDPSVQKKWRGDVLKDDTVSHSNQKGTVTYATAGPNTRTTQLFINTNDNSFLDKQGFAPCAEVVEGLELITKSVNSEYRERPDQNQIQQNGNSYLNRQFPNLSYIVTIREAGPTEGGN